jgi:hypothetical protein
MKVLTYQGNAPLSLSILSFTNEGGGQLFAGKMKNLIVFPSALSDTECSSTNNFIR